MLCTTQYEELIRFNCTEKNQNKCEIVTQFHPNIRYLFIDYYVELSMRREKKCLDNCNVALVFNYHQTVFQLELRL